MANLFDLIEPAVSAALYQARSVPGQLSPAAGATPDTSDVIASRAMEVLRSDPALEHVTNAEPWYRSRVTVGAILSAAAPVLGLIGFQVSPESRDLLVGVIVALGSVVGPALTLYGRWVAKRPLGT